MSEFYKRIPNRFTPNPDDWVQQLKEEAKTKYESLSDLTRTKEEDNWSRFDTGHNNRDYDENWKHIKTPVDRGANTMYAVMLLCLLSTILTIALYVCYKKQVKTVNMRDFAIAVMALNTLCCALSIVLLCCRGLGNDPESYRAFIIVIILLLEIGDIVGSIYIYLQL
jgi:hypothetical protein